MAHPAEVLAIERIGAVPTILRVISEVTGLRLSLVAHVTDDRWTCCAVNDQMSFGLEVGGTLDVATTLCSEVRAARMPIVISEASRDPVYCTHPTPRRYGFESYIAVPIVLPDGEYFGNVCALDARPVDLGAPRMLATLQLFADLIGRQLAAERDQQRTSQALLDANAAAALREQFIAVLGHDLRTPLQVIAMGTERLAGAALGPDEQAVVDRIGRSAGRIARLVDDVVDFARGRLGEGIPLDRMAIEGVLDFLGHVVDELRTLHAGRTVEVRLDGHGSMYGDPTRLAQLLQNLLENALTHSPAGAPVSVSLSLEDETLTLAVSNGGPALSSELLTRIFEPYQRGRSGRPAGLGLGLYIASQIVRSHGGTLVVESDDSATTFTATLPRQLRS